MTGNSDDVPPGLQASLPGDVAEARKRFLRRLPAGARILDLGTDCNGAALEFLRLGHHVDGFDSAQVLCECSTPGRGPSAAGRSSVSETGAIIFHALPPDLRPVYNGVWAPAALLHVNASQTREAVRRLAARLVPGGVLYLSAPRGDGTRFAPDGQYFHTMDRAALSRTLNAVPELHTVDLWLTSGRRPGVLLLRRRGGWIHALAVKSRPHAPVLRFRPLPATRWPSELAVAAFNAMQGLSNLD